MMFFDNKIVARVKTETAFMYQKSKSVRDGVEAAADDPFRQYTRYYPASGDFNLILSNPTSNSILNSLTWLRLIEQADETPAPMHDNPPFFSYLPTSSTNPETGDEVYRGTRFKTIMDWDPGCDVTDPPATLYEWFAFVIKWRSEPLGSAETTLNADYGDDNRNANVGFVGGPFVPGKGVDLALWRNEEDKLARKDKFILFTKYHTGHSHQFRSYIAEKSVSKYWNLVGYRAAFEGFKPD